MKALVIYQSVHHQNTAKVAQVVAQALKAKAVLVGRAAGGVETCGLVGFGSGIYFGRFHQSLFKFVQSLPKQKGRKVFLFSTSGIPRIPLVYDFHRSFRYQLKAKGFEVVGEFNCPGWDNYPQLVRPFGGIRKNRPNTRDLERAKAFATRLRPILY